MISLGLALTELGFCMILGCVMILAFGYYGVPLDINACSGNVRPVWYAMI